MLSFRYHVVSLVAVFLALSIGIIVGTTVIDRALVDRLEEQQQLLRDDIRDAQQTNQELREELEELRESSERLGTEGGERLAAGALVGVPVVVVGIRGLEGEHHDRLVELLASAGADARGTLWLTQRFALADEADALALAEVLGERTQLPDAVLRNLGIIRLAAELREQATRVDPEGEDDPTGAAPDAGAEPVDDEVGEEAPSVLDGLVEAGFVEVDAGPEVSDGDPVVVPGTRAVVLSGDAADLEGDGFAVRIALELVAGGRPEPPMPVVAVQSTPPEPEEGTEPPDDEHLVATLRESEAAIDRLSTVDNIDQLAGRLATVLALEDLGADVTGHYGTGPGADRLVPAPPPPDGEG